MHDESACAEPLSGGPPGKGVYLYCFARPDVVLSFEGKGVDGQHPLFLRRFHDVAAVASMISVEDFSGSAAEARMQDLFWLGPRVCLHEKAIEEVMRHSPVLPVRFGTIFSSLRILDETLDKHHDAILHFLDWVADKEEWGVKGVLNRGKAKEQLFSEAVAACPQRLASLSPGTRYVQEQRMRTAVEKGLSSYLRQACGEMREDLSDYACEWRERKVLSGDVDGREMVANWAFLLARGAVTEFRERIEQANKNHAERGLVFEMTGPWPPYSFCPPLEENEER